jgi:hypothetical protein
MRSKAKSKKPSPEKPNRKSGSQAPETQSESLDSRPQVEVDAPDTPWTEAKWLALADQALSE